MESKEEVKEKIERNKQIRAKENAHQKDVLKSTLNDKDMKEYYDLKEKQITTTSKDDAREKRRKIIIGIVVGVVVLAAVAVGLYFLLKK